MKKAIHLFSLALALLLTVSLLGAAFVGAAESADPFKSASVTLDDALTVNFIAEVTDTENAIMTFMVAGATKELPVSQAQHVEGSLYSFPCSIGAVKMTDTITATLEDSGNTYQKQTSVRDYAQKLFATKQWDKLAANEMVLATLHYGGALQSYAGYNTDKLANEGYKMPAAPEIPAVDTQVLSGTPVEGFHIKSASLYLASNVSVRFKFTVDGDISGYTFSTGSAPVATGAAGEYYIEVGDINPQDYDKLITLTVNDTFTITYSPMHYISAVYNNASTQPELKTLMGAMYQYHLTAQEYIGDPLGNGKDNLVSAQ